MYDTVYEFLLNLCIWILSLHENELWQQIVIGGFFKITQICGDIGFIDDIVCNFQNEDITKRTYLIIQM